MGGVIALPPERGAFLCADGGLSQPARKALAALQPIGCTLYMVPLGERLGDKKLLKYLGIFQDRACNWSMIVYNEGMREREANQVTLDERKPMIFALAVVCFLLYLFLCVVESLLD